MFLERARFENRFVATLPGDTTGDRTPRATPNAAYALTPPTPVAAPQIRIVSPEMAALFGATPADFDSSDAAVLAGNRVLPALQPYAACYAGHQFGHWAGQLGDGRAITLTEILDTENRAWELQLKGAGRTPYSRRGDGRAVLRSSIREYVASEAFAHLGVPTTRALALLTTGDDVMRDMFYDGRPAPEPGAIVVRMAPSFLRFGNFQMPAVRGETDLLKKLVEWTFAFFPDLPNGSFEEKLFAFFDTVAERTADLMVHWQRIGFAHGVMNTDNLSILGLTIDYGPYGFLESYDPLWTPNTTDLPGRRYGFGRQPSIAFWNVARLTEALAPLVATPQTLFDRLEVFQRRFEHGYAEMLRAKLGFFGDAKDIDAAGVEVLRGLDDVLAAGPFDYTLFFRALSRWMSSGEKTEARRRELFADSSYTDLTQNLDADAKLAAWLARHDELAAREPTPTEDRVARMNRVNPIYIPRNYQLSKIIEAATAGDYAPLEQMMDVLRTPYTETPLRADYAKRRPAWAENLPGSSTLSCSS